VIDYVLEEWNLSEIGIRIVRIGRGDDGRNALYLLGAVGAPISVYDGRAIRGHAWKRVELPLRGHV
jgi:hypothetical protein